MSLTMEWNDARLRKEAALIPPRAALGASMVYHGLGKLRQGAPEQVGGWFENIGLKPGKPLAIATGIAMASASAGRSTTASSERRRSRAVRLRPGRSATSPSSSA